MDAYNSTDRTRGYTRAPHWPIAYSNPLANPNDYPYQDLISNGDRYSPAYSDGYPHPFADVYTNTSANGNIHPDRYAYTSANEYSHADGYAYTSANEYSHGHTRHYGFGDEHQYFHANTGQPCSPNFTCRNTL